MTKLMILVCMLGAAACGTARSQAVYAADASRLLETRNGDLQRCYNEVLKAQPGAAGIVTVSFVVVPSSGTIKDATIAPGQTTAPDALGRCVLDAMVGLNLTPPDRNEGHATFVYEFRPSPSAPAAKASS
jgi:hypothetical protein